MIDESITFSFYTYVYKVGFYKVRNDLIDKQCVLLVFLMKAIKKFDVHEMKMVIEL